jgi:PKD repeat protein
MIKKASGLLVLIFLLTNPGLFSQVKNIKGEKGFAVKEATVNMKEIGKRHPEVKSEIPEMKVPNEEWEEQPHFGEISSSEIIYKAPADMMKRSLIGANREVSPAPDTTFQALYDNGHSIPPDVNGVAGINNLMVTLNTQVRIQDRDGNNLMTTSLSNFWEPMPNNAATFDPKILYDPYENRWIMVTPSSSNSNDSRIYIGVTVTSDPLGDWHMFWIDSDPQNITWFDYPSIGFNKRWIVVNGNMFGGDFYSTVFVIDKEAAYNGDDNVPYTRFATNLGFTIVPSITYDSLFDDIYLISTANGNSGGYGYIRKFIVTGDLQNPQFIYQGAIGIPYTWDGGEGDFLPQLGTNAKINSVDSRMENVIYRNGKLWAVHHVFLPADNPQRCALQWWNLDAGDGTLLDYGRIEDTTNLFSFAFPTIAVNANEDVLIGHDIFSSTQYASAGYSYKANFDTLFRDFYQYKDGLAPYNKKYGGNRNRWGDYSATCVDPVSDYDFWTIQEYAELPQGQDKWGTWWAFMKPMFSPMADFSADNIVVPTGDTVNFTDLTLGVPTSWNWTFVGGVPENSTEQNPSKIVYPDEGVFDVELIASNILGDDTAIKTAYITVSSSILPEVYFSSDKFFVCTGDTVSFFDSTLYMPHQWQWQFEPASVTFVNGTNENSENPKVVFNDAGLYSVTLTAWNLNGQSSVTKEGFIQAGGYVPFFHETFEEPVAENHWTVENPDDDATWEPYTVGGTSPGNTAMAVNFREVFGIGRKDRLISPPLNLENMNEAYMEFQHAFAQRNAGVSDSLIVMVSPDCGITWTRVFEGGENGNGNFATHQPTNYDFVPSVASDWCGLGWGSACNTIDLSPWTGLSNVKIAFETYSMYGNPVFVDNFFVDRYTGTGDVKNQNCNINVFPNPAVYRLTVSWDNNMAFDNLKILNGMGNVVLNRTVDIHQNGITLDISLLKAGVYTVMLKNRNTVKVKKIVVFK